MLRIGHRREGARRDLAMAIEAGKLEGAPSWHTPQHGRVGLAALGALILLLVAAGYALTVLVFYPGYVTVDASYVYADVQAWQSGRPQFGDWQSPVMTVLWRLIDPIAPGSVSIFLLTVTLYWLGFGVLALVALRYSTLKHPALKHSALTQSALRRSRLLALATPFLALLPPAFFFVGMVWRDILFGVIWLVAAVIVLAAAESALWWRRTVQAVALFLIAIGVLLRQNAIFAAPFLAAHAVWPTRFDVRRMAIVFVPAVVLSYTLVPLVYYGLLDAKRQNPLHSILVFDLGGITRFSGENQFPVAWNADQTKLLRGACYDPEHWDTYWHLPPCAFVMQRLERPDDVIFGTWRLTAAWWRAVATHPLAYLEHRATFMWQFLARSNLVLPVWDWREASSAYGHSPYFTPLLALHNALQPTLLFRPGSWLVLAVAVFGLSWRARSTPSGAFAVTVTASAIVYMLTFFFVGVAADFRYAYWCVLATLTGAVAATLPPRVAVQKSASFSPRIGHADF
jgi:hypothetical protein